ncbi:uncharacterized protein DS421_13g434010 [Arachis hypogaea]|nr:uncharacterized protein LOC112792202 isoform X2 [Arachis hypogaea]QHO03654.1 uncharacterized protein DS421_13g434010 [Arachis hypogaea]
MSFRGGRVPNLSSSRMRMFLEQKRGEKDGSGKTILPETAQSSSHAMKRKKTEFDKSLEVVSAEAAQGAIVQRERPKQMQLHGFARDSNSRSVWSDQFPISKLDNKVGQFPGDVDLLKDTGMEAVGQYMQVIATRMLCIGRTMELLGAGEKEYVDKIALLEELLLRKRKSLLGGILLLPRKRRK